MLGMTCGKMLAEKYGAVLVFPDYRLAWQDPYPAALEDCYAALKWMYDNAAELGIDRERIIVGGESPAAGSRLLSAYMPVTRVRFLSLCSCRSIPCLTARIPPPRRTIMGRFGTRNEITGVGNTILVTYTGQRTSASTPPLPARLITRIFLPAIPSSPTGSHSTRRRSPS